MQPFTKQKGQALETKREQAAKEIEYKSATYLSKRDELSHLVTRWKYNQNIQIQIEERGNTAKQIKIQKVQNTEVQSYETETHQQINHKRKGSRLHNLRKK